MAKCFTVSQQVCRLIQNWIETTDQYESKVKNKKWIKVKVDIGAVNDC